ncbi:hypothetical protein RPALISO_133 [Ruegeria phage RpAliso]|nr:hypothetical protein RPALISO_133 [Ruegeria phage RpAliso]
MEFKAFLIDPFVLQYFDGTLQLTGEPPIREVQMTRNIRDIYNVLTPPDRRKVTTFEACMIDGTYDGDVAYVDEEGLMRGDATHFVRIKGFVNPFAGRAIVMGTDAEGDSIAPRTTLSALWERVELSMGNASVKLKDVPVGAPMRPAHVSLEVGLVAERWGREMAVW